MENSQDENNLEVGEKIIKKEKGHLSWKVLFLLFIITKILIQVVSVKSHLGAGLSLLSGILLAMALVDLFRQLIVVKK